MNQGKVTGFTYYNAAHVTVDGLDHFIAYEEIDGGFSPTLSALEAFDTEEEALAWLSYRRQVHNSQSEIRKKQNAHCRISPSRTDK